MDDSEKQLLEEGTYLLKVYLAQYVGAQNQLALIQRTFLEAASYVKEIPQKYSIVDKRIAKAHLKTPKRILLTMQHLSQVITIIAEKLKERLTYSLFLFHAIPHDYTLQSKHFQLGKNEIQKKFIIEMILMKNRPLR